MKQVKALHITLFIAGILAVLFVVTYNVPKDGWEVAGHKWKFLTFEKFIHPKKQKKKDIADIKKEDTEIKEDPRLKHVDQSSGNLGAPTGGELDENASTELIMNDKGRENLNAFFKTLSGVAANRQKISILHYGDSQIEGDRMTNFLRQRIQDQFGGFGPGLVAGNNVYSTISYKQTFSETFKRYTAFGGASLKSGKYGVMASAARFTPEMVDSVDLDTMAVKTGWIEIESSKSAYQRARTYNNVKMHYNDCTSPVKVNVYENGSLIHEEDLVTDGAQHTLKLSFSKTPGKLKFEFTGKVSPNVCAFSLEGDYGVQVSNIGMRGCSGTMFGRINSATARPMYSELNTKLIIMQFGGNSLVHFKDSAAVRRYANYFQSNINRVKSMNPGAMVIVIGPSDMSELDEGIYETYELLPYTVQMMREATLATGSAFWSLYGAMGGKNSMPSWVEDGLAGSDHVHFTNAGSRLASQKFYKALVAEYAKWKKTQ